MNFTLTTLGTASAMPVVGRNQSAQVLEVHGRLFLIDCGEGTQQKLLEAKKSFIKIEAIFISHIHGDHIFGLFGLLSTMGMYGRTAKLPVYGPKALGGILKFFLSYFGEGLSFEIEYHEVPSDLSVIHNSKFVKVSSFPLNHQIDCFGYRFDAVRGPKTPEDAHLPSYAYCSDTAPFDAESDYVRGVDVLFHEATYPSEFSDKAVEHYHSTSLDAASCALRCGAGALIIGHYSSRFRDTDIYLEECRSIFRESYAANDLDVFEIPYISRP
ncbi:MAG: ribonuclease Z [Bacteroidales bacterium]|nr:ribonuclease Z [Bacteroidales bacterium]